MTGSDIFADVYEREQKLARWGTQTKVSVVSGRAGAADDKVYAVSVTPRWPGLTRQPKGSVEVSVDGTLVGSPIPLDSTGLAPVKGSELAGRGTDITARYIPADDSNYIPSDSPVIPHTSGNDTGGSGTEGDTHGKDKKAILMILFCLLILLFVLWLLVKFLKR